MGRDLIASPYGRFFNLPLELARQGHEVHIALLSYRQDRPVDLTVDGIHWTSDSIYSRFGFSYLSRVRQLADQLRPDWIVGCSDTYFGILAQKLGKKYGRNSIIDAYDNYEGYLSWCKPLHAMWRASLRRATAISAAGPALLELMSQGRPSDSAIVASMAPDPVGFVPLPKGECRSELNLPQDKQLIGYAGGIFPSRGIDLLFRAVADLKLTRPDLQLVLSGRVHSSVELPKDAIWLGYLPDDRMPMLLNSLDVAAVVNKRSAFGDHSYPIKLYEAMSCSVPVVASRTPATEWILRNHPKHTVTPGDINDLARGIDAMLDKGRVDYDAIPTWGSVAESLGMFLTRLSQNQRDDSG